MQQSPANLFTVDVEDWFHILDSPAVPPVERWDGLESRLERNLDLLFEDLEQQAVRGTFFWLGWIAERHPELVRRCQRLGHEVASHGYGHLLAYQVGRTAFAADIRRARAVLEQLTGERVSGFRAPGFGITGECAWAFDAICEAGYAYDSSIFPGARGHGGIAAAPIGPHLLQTASGPLPEIPMSMVRILGRRVNLFGGGYLRLAPLPLIRWGIARLHRQGQPLVIYVHPREVDPHHPRLPLSLPRRFKSYVNLKSTRPKLQWLCRNHRFMTMREYCEARFAPAIS